MAEYLIQDSTLEDIGDAIRVKTGKSAAMTPAEMVTEIERIQTGEGGSLPSIISKIDGGSFTLASDTAGNAHWISHNLGALPKAIFIWTDDSDLRASTSAVAQRYLLCSEIVLLDWTTGTASNAIMPSHLFRNTNGLTGNTGSPISAAVVGNYIQTTRFNNALSSAYYKAGVEYKWVAYA